MAYVYCVVGDESLSLHVPREPCGRAGSESKLTDDLVPILEYLAYSNRTISGSKIIGNGLFLDSLVQRYTDEIWIIELKGLPSSETRPSFE
jgi:hypothetical protein